MADVRALLRQQREARRITHPHASYSAAGKLVCTLCREAIKADSLWGSHVRGKDHRERAGREQNQSGGNAKAAVEEADAEEKGGELRGVDTPSIPSAPDASVAGPRPLKRKLEEDHHHIDVDVDPVDHNDNGSGTTTSTDDAARRKRSKADSNMETPPLSGTIPTSSSSNAATGAADKHPRDQNLTPPSAGGGVGGIGWRRAPGTPSAGIEINIPSRPATPAAHRGEGGSSSSTPTAGVAMTLPMAKKAAGAVGVAAAAAAAAEAVAAANPDAATATPTDNSVDEAEWAAFEADMAALDQLNGQDGGAVLSAPPMTAEESAAAAAAAAAAAENGEEGGEKVGFARDREIMDEREDATRALEEEFDDMEALEARVRILKERREALRKLSEAAGGGGQDAGDNERKNPGYAERVTEQADGGDEEEDDDEDDEEDGWTSFRFQA